ncbi:MAG: T9SS type A sorting domain-containing protein [Saprospiraceae bacterium]|nr:T9SS type A sorting domain-containing protein [Saprospiraceae bacterium]
MLSTLNESNSLQCSPAGINNPFDPATPTLSVSETNGDFAYHVFHEDELNIDWTLNDGRKLLFVIAIDAFPGEEVSLGGFSFSFLLPPPNNMPCIGFIVPCDQIGGLSAKEVDLPNLCSNPLMLRFATALDEPVPGYPNRKRIPVILTSADNAPTLYDIDEMDFLATLTTSQLMPGVSIVGGKIPAAQVLLYNEISNDPMNKRIYAKSGSMQVVVSKLTAPTIDNTLFSIVIDGPALESDCGTVDLAFMAYRRMIFSGSCCQTRAGTAALVEWNEGDCPTYCPGTIIRIAEATTNVPPTAACEDAFLDVFIQSNSTVVYNEAHVSMMLKHSGTLDWTSVNSNSVYCVNMPFCVTSTQVDAATLRIDFSIDGTPPLELSAPLGEIQLVRLAFKGHEFCITSASFSDARLLEDGETVYCLPSVGTSLTETTNADDVCNKSLVFKYTIYDGNPMKEINYSAGEPLACLVTGTALDYGTASICQCLNPGITQTFTPLKNDNPLNGLTTYDLVLISKHILGIEPLGSPYKMIAADANKSNSVTTSDIVELRKLILGIYTSLPNNTSWRFVPQSYVFPNPLNPFAPDFPETMDFTVPPNETTVEFYGIKVGDVNNTVVQRSESGRELAYGAVSGASGSVVEVPVFSAESFAKTAWQTAIHYDAAKLKLLDVRWPNALGSFQAREWHEPQPGNVRMLWYDGQGIEHLAPEGAPLCYLRFECLTEAPDVELSLDRQAPSLAYNASGIETALSLKRSDMALLRREPSPVVDTTPDWEATAYPNPAGERFRLELNLPAASGCRMVVYDLLGNAHWAFQKEFQAGHHILNDLPALPAGQYLIRFDTDWGSKTLRLVKQ